MHLYDKNQTNDTNMISHEKTGNEIPSKVFCSNGGSRGWEHLEDGPNVRVWWVASKKGPGNMKILLIIIFGPLNLSSKRDTPIVEHYLFRLYYTR